MRMRLTSNAPLATALVTGMAALVSPSAAHEAAAAEPAEVDVPPATAGGSPWVPHAAVPTEATVFAGELDATSRAVLAGGAVVTMWRTLVGSTLRADREAVWYSSHASPSFALWAPLADLSAGGGPTIVGGSRYRGVGPENAGSAVEGWIVVEERAGPLALAGQAMVGRGIGERTDVDAEAVATALATITPELHLGAEARARTEIEDELETDEDVGRPAEVMVGGVGVWQVLPSIQLTTHAGWRSPRGSASPGVLGLGAVTHSF